ncbi:hypothetical protein AK88_04285 [Plasmodium fragile]|uniref:Schizont-infected cell agglutination C-terminal domain-containing protein n=1 Tax=Plasmodium fragile TaxID=5857 RepID=A0A0D9QGH1_PLAFR|nr:uncharacterized protein AK88_04285 [Plasmodium fragile]KJP86094.1 hypothetical protein AK88_04285 [Plasmodium fragile]
MQLETDPCAPNAHDPDPWSCMQHIQLDAEQNAHSNPAHATSACTHWINCIDRNKHLLQDCTTQPWFLQLKADWKQYLREHMAADADNGHRAFGELATLPMMKLWLWKAWVAQQHRKMSVHSHEAWFQRLFNNVEDQTVPQNGDVPGVGNDLEVEKVMEAEDSVRDLPRSQLHQHLYMNKRLTAKTLILILALVIEQCELESRLQETELYVDELLQKLCN